MRKVFLALLKKKIFYWGEGFAWGGLAKLGCFRFFDQLWRQSHGPKFWRKLFLETTQSPASIEPLLNLLACLEPKLWPKNPILPPKSENAWVSHWRLAITSDNSPPEDASELYEPSKDSWSLLVCTKKHFRFGFGVFGGWDLKKSSLDFFQLFLYDVIASTKGQNFGSKFGWILGWNMKL